MLSRYFDTAASHWELIDSGQGIEVEKLVRVDWWIEDFL